MSQAVLTVDFACALIGALAGSDAVEPSSPQDAMPNGYRWAPGETVGRYVIEATVARGGMGEVYRARHGRTGQRVALKTVQAGHAHNLEFLGRFTREAQVLGQVDHPNVVKVVDFDEHGGTLYLVMEWLSGETLGTKLARVKRLNEREAMRLLLQLCSAVAALHERGVVHRDLKPENIFVLPGARGEVVKVVDFGIATAGELGRDGVVTGTGDLYGTAWYMSPEQWSGAKNVTPASDQFSLGVIAYECVTGKLPFDVEDRTNFPAIRAKAQAGEYTSPRALCPEVSTYLEAVIERMLATDPAARFPSVREVRQALLHADEETTQVFAELSLDALATLPLLRGLPTSPAPAPREAAETAAPAPQGASVAPPRSALPHPAAPSVAPGEAPDPGPREVVGSEAAPSPRQRSRAALYALVLVAMGSLSAWTLSRHPRPPAPALPPRESRPSPPARPPVTAVPTTLAAQALPAQAPAAQAPTAAPPSPPTPGAPRPHRGPSGRGARRGRPTPPQQPPPPAVAPTAPEPRPSPVAPVAQRRPPPEPYNPFAHNPRGHR